MALVQLDTLGKLLAVAPETVGDLATTMDEGRKVEASLQLLDSMAALSQHDKVHLGHIRTRKVEASNFAKMDTAQRGSQNHNYCKKLVKSQIYRQYCRLRSNRTCSLMTIPLVQNLTFSSYLWLNHTSFLLTFS